MAKFWHFSDTHGLHNDVVVPENIDFSIFSGDGSNSKIPYENQLELISFLEWYGLLDIKHKIFVAGNHETSITSNLVTRGIIESYGLIYLENEDVTITIDGNDIKIWGSPYSPQYSVGWSFTKPRNTINRIWDNIPLDSDIVVTHTPPIHILDATKHQNNSEILHVGCSALSKALLRIKPQYSLFGHIHSNKYLDNTGTRKLSNNRTIYSNGTCVKDNNMGTINTHGNILHIYEKTNNY